MYTMFTVSSPYAGTDTANVLPGPSMNYFFQNVARVTRGEWWFYDNSDSLKDYKTKARLLHESDAKEFPFLIFLCSCLAFDYFGVYARDVGIENVRPEAVTAGFTTETSYVMLMEEILWRPCNAC
jgi:hypothetical protein